MNDVEAHRLKFGFSMACFRDGDCDTYETRIYDYIDLRVPVCDSMYRKRLQGYKAVGYSIAVANEGLFAEPTTETMTQGGQASECRAAEGRNLLRRICRWRQ